MARYLANSLRIPNLQFLEELYIEHVFFNYHLSHRSLILDILVGRYRTHAMIKRKDSYQHIHRIDLTIWRLNGKKLLFALILKLKNKCFYTKNTGKSTIIFHYKYRDNENKQVLFNRIVTYRKSGLTV